MINVISEQAETTAARDRVPPGGDPELAVHRAQMRLDGIDRQEQRIGNLLVGNVRWQEPQYSELTASQRHGRGRRPLADPPRAGVEALQDPRGKPGALAAWPDQHREGGPDRGPAVEERPAGAMRRGQHERPCQVLGRLLGLAEPAMRHGDGYQRGDQAVQGELAGPGVQAWPRRGQRSMVVALREPDP